MGLGLPSPIPGLHNIPLAGSLFGNPHEKAMQQELRAAQQAYGDYRPQAAQGHLDAYGQTVGAFAPANQALQSIYGVGLDLGPLTNPLDPSMGGQDSTLQAAPQGGGMAGDWDQTGPGAGEQFYAQQGGRMTGPSTSAQWWGDNQSAFGAPGEGQQFWNQVQGQWNAPTASSQALSNFHQSGMGDIGAAYDRAQTRTGAAMNDQLAARGAYGSSAGMDQVGQTIADLQARRAADEAQFGLQRAGLEGQLAGQADAAGMRQLGMFGDMAFGADASGLQRLAAGTHAAGQADQADMQRFATGGNMAMAAQQQRDQRIQQALANLMGASSGIANLRGGTLGSLMDTDMALLDGQLGMGLGAAREALNQDYRRGEQLRGDIGFIMDSIGTGKDLSSMF